MQVSVPGMYQKPAPYREQIFTYSTALAFTGRSAACAPLMAIRPAAEPRIRLLTIFISNLQVALKGRFRIRWVNHPMAGALLPPSKPPKPFRVIGHTRINARDFCEPPLTVRPT